MLTTRSDFIAIFLFRNSIIVAIDSHVGSTQEINSNQFRGVCLTRSIAIAVITDNKAANIIAYAYWRVADEINKIVIAS